MSLQVSESYTVNYDVSENGEAQLDVCKMENRKWKIINTLKGMDALLVYKALTDKNKTE